MGTTGRGVLARVLLVLGLTGGLLVSGAVGGGAALAGGRSVGHAAASALGATQASPGARASRADSTAGTQAQSHGKAHAPVSAQPGGRMLLAPTGPPQLALPPAATSLTSRLVVVGLLARPPTRLVASLEPGVRLGRSPPL